MNYKDIKTLLEEQHRKRNIDSSTFSKLYTCAELKEKVNEAGEDDDDDN